MATILAHLKVRPGMQVSPHHEAASPALGDVLEGIRLEWVDPVQSAAPLPPTEMQDLSQRASELEATHHHRFAAQVAGRWLALR